MEIALQQLSLNAAQQLSHFYGICRTEGTIMLVYEYVEVSLQLSIFTFSKMPHAIGVLSRVPTYRSSLFCPHTHR